MFAGEPYELALHVVVVPPLHSGLVAHSSHRPDASDDWHDYLSVGHDVDPVEHYADPVEIVSRGSARVAASHGWWWPPLPSLGRLSESVRAARCGKIPLQVYARGGRTISCRSSGRGPSGMPQTRLLE